MGTSQIYLINFDNLRNDLRDRSAGKIDVTWRVLAFKFVKIRVIVFLKIHDDDTCCF